MFSCRHPARGVHSCKSYLSCTLPCVPTTKRQSGIHGYSIPRPCSLHRHVSWEKCVSRKVLGNESIVSCPLPMRTPPRVAASTQDSSMMKRQGAPILAPKKPAPMKQQSHPECSYVSRFWEHLSGTIVRIKSSRRRHFALFHHKTDCGSRICIYIVWVARVYTHDSKHAVFYYRHENYAVATGLDRLCTCRMSRERHHTTPPASDGPQTAFAYFMWQDNAAVEHDCEFPSQIYLIQERPGNHASREDDPISTPKRWQSSKIHNYKRKKKSMNTK